MSLVASKVAVAPARRNVVCGSVAQPTRRAFLGATLLPALIYAPKALALIPDEEDEDLVEKAKANRRARLAQQRGVTRDFIVEERLRDRAQEQELVPVQKAVYNLAKSGGQLSAGDLTGAASTLSESWVADFTAVATTVSGSETASRLTSGIKGIQASAASGDATGSKQQFVALVADLRSWAAMAGLSSGIKGL